MERQQADGVRVGGTQLVLVLLGNAYRGGTLDIRFSHLAHKPPFDGEELRRQFLDRLNRVPGVSLPESTLDRWPNLPLSVLAEEEGFAALTEALMWFANEIKEHARRSSAHSSPEPL